jgi:hypothetical protein
MTTKADIAAYEERRARVASFGRADLVVPDRYNRGPVIDEPQRSIYDLDPEADLADDLDAFSAQVEANERADALRPTDEQLLADDAWLLAAERRNGKA